MMLSYVLPSTDLPSPFTEWYSALLFDPGPLENLGAFHNDCKGGPEADRNTLLDNIETLSLQTSYLSSNPPPRECRVKISQRPYYAGVRPHAMTSPPITFSVGGLNRLTLESLNAVQTGAFADVFCMVCQNPPSVLLRSLPHFC